MNVIKLERITRSTHQLSVTYCFNDYRFEVALWYDVDLLQLEKRFGSEFLQLIYFHIAAFEFNKLISLKPDLVDFGDYKDFCTPTFLRLWQHIQQKVWAQWRYENDLPAYKGPQLNHALSSQDLQPKVTNSINPENNILAFCGGGKDSLVAARMLETLELPYSSFVYSNSIYGQAEKQHQIIDRLVSNLKPEKVHRQYVYDSFVDCPILKLDSSINTKVLLAAETPSSIFASLPIVLAEGYQYIALAHEKSANVGNLIWQKTGEDVNHQWGKSFEAEQLLNTYIQNHLISNFAYFSLLQPIYDVLIFNLLQESLDLVPFTHSCNIDKPWCKKCPKCAYVWLNYMAYLPVDLVNQIFDNTNLFDLPENQLWFKQMLGLGQHTPFECIGQVEESRLALHLCKIKGLSGKAMAFYEEIKEENFMAITDKFTKVDEINTGYPKAFEALFLQKLKETAINGKQYISQFLRPVESRNT